MRYRIFNQWRTFWLFLGQILSATQACQEALIKARFWLALSAPEKENISPNTCGYCKARGRLKQDYLDDVEREVRNQQRNQVSAEHLWCGRPIKVVDGTSVSMRDNPTPKRIKNFILNPKAKKRDVVFRL